MRASCADSRLRSYAAGKATTEVTETRFVEDDAGLRQLVADLESEPVIAIDTEFLTENNYYPRLCLVQLAGPRLMATVDPFACKELTPLGELLAGVGVMVLHAGSQDLTILRRLFGTLPENIFDTQIAAAFLGYGHSISYARLVDACCGAKLKRSRAYTDWAKRPLDPDQLEYALDDVRYLMAIHQQLSDGLARRNRLRWAQEEFEKARAVALEDLDPREQWRRLAGKRATRRKELAVLRELAAWREEEARRRDRPRQRVVADRVVQEIARRRPTRVEELSGTRGLHPRELKRSGAAIIAAVKAGLDAPADSLPPNRKPSRFDTDPQIGVAAAFADTYLKTRARELDLAPQLLANRKDLEAIVRLLAENGGPPPDSDIRLLSGWRREVAGADVLRVLAGEIGLRVVVRKGGVDLVVEDEAGPPPGPASS